MKGKYTYNTKVGAILTFLYLGTIGLALAYFLGRFFDKTNPMLQYTTYRDKTYVDNDIIADDFNLVFLMLTKQHQPIIAEEFVKSFSIYGTVATLVTQTGQMDKEGEAVKIVPCKEATWVKNLGAKAKGKKGWELVDKELGHLSMNAWCFDIPKARVYKDDNDVRTIKLELASCGTPSSLYMFNLPTGAPRYNVNPMTCTNQYSIGDVTMMLYAVNTTIETDDYEAPVKKFMDTYNTSYFYAGQGYKTRIQLSKLHVNTDKGSLVSNWFKEEHVIPQPFEIYPFPWVGGGFFQPPYWTLNINPSNVLTSIKRKYVTIMDVLAQVGGVMANLTQFFTLGYFFYNYYRKTEEIIKNDILVDESLYTEDYQFSKSMTGMYWRNSCCCRRTKFKSANEEKLERNFRAAQDIMNQAMDIENFIRDSVELQLLKGLFIKERHRVLMPLLAMSTASKKLELDDKLKSKGKFIQSVGARDLYNMNEHKGVKKMDVDEAVSQLKMGLHKSDYEKMVDQFFIENMPTAAYRQKRTEHGHIPRDSNDFGRNSVQGGESSGLMGVNSPSNRSINKRQSSAQIKKKPKRNEKLAEMVSSAYYENDAQVYGDDQTVDLNEKFKDDVFTMSKNGESNYQRKGSHKGTRLRKRNSDAGINGGGDSVIRSAIDGGGKSNFSRPPQNAENDWEVEDQDDM